MTFSNFIDYAKTFNSDIPLPSRASKISLSIPFFLELPNNLFLTLYQSISRNYISISLIPSGKERREERKQEQQEDHRRKVEAKKREEQDRLAIANEKRKRYGLKRLNKEENMRIKKRTEEGKLQEMV